MKQVYALIAAVMMLVPIPVMADFAVMGIGTETCSQLGNDLSNPAKNGVAVELILMSWVQGYLSAANVDALHERHEYRDMAAMSIDEQKRKLLAYCSEHPLAPIADAAANLYYSLPLKPFTSPNASHR